MTERTIAVDYLARVEGEGALRVRLDGRQISEIELRIFEPPRFFEALLRGRQYTEAPDITARICGICPVAYQMSACHAVERALGVRVDGALRDLRRILYCGEWIESHALHLYLLHAPDFLGYPDAVRLAKDRPDLVRQGLALKKAGNTILTTLGGREIHPVNIRVGGFYRLPSREELETLRLTLREAIDLAEATVRFTAGLEFPDVDEPYEFVALRHPEEYPMTEGRIVSSAGLSLDPEAFDTEFEEVQVPHSNALHCRRRGGGSYLVGPLARYSLNADHLTPRAAAAARQGGLGREERNPYRSIVVRAVETLFACEEALRLIERYRAPERAWIPPPTDWAGGIGAAITEAPRGMLYHRYRLAADGRIEEARIVPPTSQNQKRIEDDLRSVVGRTLDLDDAGIADACEKAIRNHDPCISCATHFLHLDLERHDGGAP
jgi:sulfhydrogenase subunit alpha